MLVFAGLINGQQKETEKCLTNNYNLLYFFLDSPVRADYRVFARLSLKKRSRERNSGSSKHTQGST